MGIFDIKPPGEEVAQIISEYKNRNIEYYKTDTSCRDNVRKSFKSFFEHYKRIDIVIGNAGILNENAYEMMVNINLVSILINHINYTKNYTLYEKYDFMINLV